MQNEKVRLRQYIRTKFSFLSKEHQDLLNGLAIMLRGTFRDMEKAQIGGRHAMLKHTLSMANFPVRQVFASSMRLDSKWQFVKLP
jgi:hypothetical protein